MDIVANILENSPGKYEFLFHDKQIYSAVEGAEYFGIETGQTAPTLIVETEKGYLSIIFSGCREQLDFAYIAEILGTSYVKLAPKRKVQAITGFAPGDTPMVGLTLPTVFDKRLLQYPFVYGGSGKPGRTLKISPRALIALNHPIAYLECK
jgi:Cys-tRNA(Pro)/Cys-tRNA(Cys) deacylase